ncbi:MAG: DUF4012 domain-containing protein [Candidatus Levybacteria bacterium]|nr:DUF4012 domain-containing protein [Candidatus Levybacteria bacterium]
MEGFEKIELVSPSPKTNSASKTSQPVTQTTPSQRSRRSGEMGISRFGKLAAFVRFRNKKVGVGLLILTIIVLVLIIIPALLTFFSAKRTYAQVNATIAALKKQDIEATHKELEKTRESLKDTQNKLKLLFVMKFIPGPNIYYSDATHLVNAGFYGLDAADVFVESVEPYADILGLKGQGSFVGGPAEQRIETAVKTMGKVTPRIDDIVDSLKKAQAEIAYVNPNDYPAFILGGKVRQGMVTLRTLSDDGTNIIDQARPFIKVLPSLLGEPEEKKYLILFQNDKELRPTGGFLTAYAIFRVNKGIVHVERSEDIYVLDDSISGKEKAPESILKYLPKVPVLHLRDSNLSPDFQESMKVFRKLYDKAGRSVDVDGIIAVDTHALVAAMNVLGDIEANGQTYTTKIDERCDCPQVIYALEEFAGIRVQYIRSDRKSIIGDLMYAIMTKAFSSSPKLYWGPLIQTAFGEISQKHILFSLEDKDAMEGLLAVNAAGKILPFEGDYFHLNETNFGGAKSNLFTDQNVLQEITIGEDGTITKKVTVNYKNPHKPSNCNLEAENSLCLNAPWRNWFRVYVPKGSKLKDSSGSEVKMTTYTELGKTVFEGFLTVRPLGIGRLTLEYVLPFKLEKGSPLPLMIQKQGGTADDEYTIKVNGKEKEKFVLDTDKTLKLDL